MSNGATYAIDGLEIMLHRGSRHWITAFCEGNGNVLGRFTTDAHAAGAKQYLAALSATLKRKAAAVSTHGQRPAEII